jgi:putative ABC transport system ATP-binding protein
MTDLIQFQQVSKVFNSQDRVFKALSDLNFTIAKGEYTAIVGKSGSGKSTLLNLISGIDFSSEGQVVIDGQVTAQLNESQLAQWRGSNIGIVFQFFQLIPTLTILENLLMAMEFVGRIKKANRTKKTMSLLEQVGIADHWNKFPSALSGGEQQRAAIARALANDPKMVIADEPTGNLDNKTAAEVNALLLKLTKSGVTVVVVTHDRDNDQAYDRIITLDDGKIVPEVATTSLKNSEVAFT